MMSQTPNNIIITQKSNYPTNLPPEHTENDDIVPEFIHDNVFFDPNKSIKEEMEELEDYENNLEIVSR